MSASLGIAFAQIQQQIEGLTINEFHLSSQEKNEHSQKIESILRQGTSHLPETEAQRIRNEYHSWGPLNSLLEDEDITEILVNGPQHIWFEKEGQLIRHPDSFLSPVTFRNVLDRICLQAHLQLSVENPCADGSFLDFRVSLIGHELTRQQIHLSLRRHPKNPWNFEKLCHKKWCAPHDLPALQHIFAARKNFLVIGPTGSGKTSVLNSFLQLCADNERVLAIEDTSEISLPNSVSMKLLTREDSHGLLPAIDQSQLVKRALRLRPDRIAMGEIRAHEAKDFLMALATGHAGSFGTLHAQDPHQALIRLEMLIQMGAPQWSLQAVRKLIQLSLDYIVVAGKNSSGERRFKGLFRLSSLEDHGFLLEPILPASE